VGVVVVLQVSDLEPETICSFSGVFLAVRQAHPVQSVTETEIMQQTRYYTFFSVIFTNHSDLLTM
jgi:hypothetical protein